ncbi:hypothetical protein R1flu_023217 [Riccia fluitans]|uniref:RNase III domain-containing protein n=1 Tax=Riccia fluitans TaxID=41844 RepID=A0ABD1XRF4_9MARC
MVKKSSSTIRCLEVPRAMMLTSAGALLPISSCRSYLTSSVLQFSASWPWGQSASSSSPLLEVGQKAPSETLKQPMKQRVNVSHLLKRNPVVSEGERNQASGRQRQQQPWLPEAPVVEKPRAVHNAAALAYIGDAIYELYVRRHFLTPPQSMDKYNQQVMALVCCEAQHSLLQELLKKKVLTEEEKDVLRWGKNIEAGHKRAKRRAGTMVYNSASSLETLIGFLYLTNVRRLEEVMGHLGFGIEDITLRPVNSQGARSEL